MMDHWNVGLGEIERSFTPVKQIYDLTGQTNSNDRNSKNPNNVSPWKVLVIEYLELVIYL